MAVSDTGVQEFLAVLDPSLVDTEAVIADLAKEDCNDLEVLLSLSEADLLSVLSGHSLGNRKRVWNLIQDAQLRAASATGRRKRMQVMEAAAVAAGLSSSEVDSSSDEEPSLKTKNRDLWLFVSM